MTEPPWLPSPEDVPRFVEEGEADPFGQNEALLEASARKGFELARDIAALAHSRSLCLMLPPLAPPEVDPSLRPWRSLVSCTEPSGERSITDIPPPVIDWRTADVVAPQQLLQRMLLALAALEPEAQPELCDRVAEGLEHLGYLAASRHVQTNVPQSPNEVVRFVHALGRLIARLHGKNIIHGDIHADNFKYVSERDEVVVVDSDSVRQLDRPLTILERAGDLSVFKLSSAFLSWEIFKLGYRRQAPEESVGVFDLL